MIAITKDVWEKIKPRLEQEEVFIDGVSSIFPDISSVRITLQVLQYLAENTMMIRVFNTLKEAKSLF